MKRVLLEGYYNNGNYGDDLLMVVSVNFLKHLEVDVRMSEKHLSFFNEPICEIHLGDEQIIVKGGGGLYFDFVESASLKDIFLNHLFSYSIFRKLADSLLKFKPKIILLGVGVGPYTNKSSRLWRHLLAFESVDLFCLRDSESKAFIKNKGFKNVIQTTDLVFNVDLWDKYIPTKRTQIVAQTKRVGLVLRKWKFYDINYADIIKNIENHYGRDNLILYFLQDSDTELVVDLENYNYSVYKKGNEDNLFDFAKSMLDVDLMYTMRAHGAIVGACLNIPTIILPVENKLANVHKMIPDISYLNPDMYNYDFNNIELWLNNLTIATFENRIRLNQELWESKKVLIKKSFNND